jgi:hypothetical protein
MCVCVCVSTKRWVNHTQHYRCQDRRKQEVTRLHMRPPSTAGARVHEVYVRGVRRVCVCVRVCVCGKAGTVCASVCMRVVK